MARGWGALARHVALRLMTLALAALAALLVGCADVSTGASTGSGATGAGTSQTATSGTAPAATVASSGTLAGGAMGVSVFVEPQAGEAPLLHAIEGAQRSVWVEVYLLTDHNVIAALEDAANRGVETRVLLETHPYGSGSTSPTQTLDELQAAGVQAKASDPAYYYTHEKALIVDGATLYILTANLTKSALGGSSYAANREYGVVDTNATDVGEASAIFNADWARTTPTLTDPNLVVSPVNARGDLAAFIAGAKRSLLVEDEEMYDQASEDALIAAAGRGVTVEVILPPPSGSSGASGDVARLRAGGVRVRYIQTVYMHAKMMVADGARGFVGSENFSATSLDQNRELGIVIADPTALAILTQTYQSDWASGYDAA